MDVIHYFTSSTCVVVVIVPIAIVYVVLVVVAVIESAMETHYNALRCLECPL